MELLSLATRATAALTHFICAYRLTKEGIVVEREAGHMWIALA